MCFSILVAVVYCQSKEHSYILGAEPQTDLARSE